MPLSRLVSSLTIVFLLTVIVGCGTSVSREDFEIKGDAAYITKHFKDFNAFITLARDISQHVIEGMEVAEVTPDLKAAKIIVFTYAGELENKYGEKRKGIWTRVVVPTAEWFRYKKDIRTDWMHAQMYILPQWVVRGLPLSAELIKAMKNE